jgi:hypothetical protein
VNYELSEIGLKFNWKLIENELKVKYRDEHSNE